MVQKKEPDQYSAEETQRRASGALRVALNTPHKPIGKAKSPKERGKVPTRST